MSGRSDRLITFYQGLCGVDLVEINGARGALDLESGIIYSADPELTEGGMIRATLPGGWTTLVHEYKVSETLLQRHARMVTLSEGGRVEDAYRDITEHQQHKVG